MATTVIVIVVILVLVGIVLAVAYPQALAQKKAKVDKAQSLVHDAVKEVIRNRDEIDNPHETGKLRLSLSAIEELLKDQDFQAEASKQAILTVVKYKEVVGELIRTGKVTMRKTGLIVRSKTLEEIGGVDDFDNITFLVENELRKYLEKVERERVKVEKIR